MSDRKKFWGKITNFTGLRNTLNKIWNTTKPFKIRELSKNLFQFVFELEEDKQKIYNGRPRVFDGQYIILKQWEDEMDPLTEPFNSSLLWIQVLPNNWLCKENGFRFKNLFENVLDVIIPESGSKLGRYMKILAVVNLDKPLYRGTNIKCNNRSVWIDFMYEQLATFCYYCGRVGHLERNCSKKKMDIHSKMVKDDQYGEWLRAVQIGKLNRQI